MKQNELIHIIEKIVPQPTYLDFDKVGEISTTNQDIAHVGVCVDLTDYVHSQLTDRERPIDFLVIHHGRGKEIQAEMRSAQIGAYGLHLALDTIPGGLIDSLAEVFGLVSLQDVDFIYKGITVPKGAVIGSPHTICFFRNMSVTPAECKLAQDFSEIGPYKEAYTKFSEPPIHVGRSSGYKRIAVSTGPSLRSEFIDQLAPYHPDLMIGGSIKEGALASAQKANLALFAIGDFTSHYPWHRTICSKSARSFACFNAGARIAQLPCVG